MTFIVRGVTAALAIVLALSPARVDAKPPDAAPSRRTECSGMTGAAFGLCNAYLAQNCNVRPTSPCQELRDNFERITGLLGFPFDPTPTPTPTLTPTVTLTPTSTGTAMPTPTATAPYPSNPCGLPDPAVGPHGGAIVIFPKIIVDDERDTVIQLTNTSLTLNGVRCFYIDESPDVGCRQINFDLQLTRYQPVQWTVSTGRIGDPTDPMDPGRVVAPPSPFLGELRCIEVDLEGAPTALNGLTGEATLLDADGQVSKYDAIAIRGLEVDADNELRLDGYEYAECPGELLFTSQSDSAPDLVLGAGSSINNVLTLVPCTQNIEEQIAPETTLLFDAFDEFEARLSAVKRFSCRYDESLGSVFPAVGSSVLYVQVRIVPSWRVCTGTGAPNRGAECTTDAECQPGVCQLLSPVVGVLETLHTNAAQVGAPAVRNLQTCGSDQRGTMTLPLFP